MSMDTNIETPAEKKYAGYKTLAAVFLALCVAVLFLPLGVFTDAWVLKEMSLLKALPALLAAESKLFGVVPSLVETSDSFIALVTTSALYVFVICLVMTVLVSLVAIFSKDNAPRRTHTAVFFFTLGTVTYALSIACACIFKGLDTSYDVFASALAAAGVLASFILMIARRGGEALVRASQFLFSFAVSVMLIYAIMHDGEATAQTMASSATFKYMLYVIFGFSVLNLICASIRTMTKGGLGFDMVRFITQLIVSLLACYVSYAEQFSGSVYLAFAIIAALVSLFQILLANLEFERIAKSKLDNAKKDSLNGFVVEQYVETYEYAGGPVDHVEVATEVNPTEAAATGTKPNLASLVGNGFDPFLFTLNEEEKAEFIDLYILRCKCLMPEIPGYAVGGDNKEFFNKVFIYLGQYRDKISNKLLQKMYDFSMKL